MLFFLLITIITGGGKWSKQKTPLEILILQKPAVTSVSTQYKFSCKAAGRQLLKIVLPISVQENQIE